MAVGARFERGRLYGYTGTMSTAPKSDASDLDVEGDEPSDWLDYARQQWAHGARELDQGQGVAVRSGAELLDRVRARMRSK